MTEEVRIAELKEEEKRLYTELDKAQDAGNRLKAKNINYRIREITEEIRTQKISLASRKKHAKEKKSSKELVFTSPSEEVEEIEEVPEEEPEEEEVAEDSVTVTEPEEAEEVKEQVNLNSFSEDPKECPTRLSQDELMLDRAMAKLFDPDFEEFIFTLEKEEVSVLMAILLKELRQLQAELSSIESFLEKNQNRSQRFVTTEHRDSVKHRKELVETIIDKMNV